MTRNTREDRLFVRMPFDTVSAALPSAQGTDAGLAEVIPATRRATGALARAATHPEQRGLA